MTQTKKELVLAALNNLPTDRVPVGFWFHFTDPADHPYGLERPEIIERNKAGHKKFYDAYGPDFIKIMSDGFFTYPNERLKNVKTIEALRGIEPVGANHPWIVKQIDFVREIAAAFGQEVLLFYNVFAPLTYLRFQQDHDPQATIAGLIKEDAEAFKKALDVIGQDLALLAKGVIAEGGADGIYLSVQSVQDAYVTQEIYQNIIAPSELAVLNAANSVSSNNILHICGYAGGRNNITWFKDHPFKAVNWAVNVEGVSLADGKEIFGGRAVIGGFDNTASGLLYKGSKAEIEAFTDGLIKGAGRTGVILGADCTVPNDIDVTRLNWVRAKAGKI